MLLHCHEGLELLSPLASTLQIWGKAASFTAPGEVRADGAAGSVGDGNNMKGVGDDDWAAAASFLEIFLVRFLMRCLAGNSELTLPSIISAPPTLLHLCRTKQTQKRKERTSK